MTNIQRANKDITQQQKSISKRDVKQELQERIGKILSNESKFVLLLDFSGSMYDYIENVGKTKINELRIFVKEIPELPAVIFNNVATYFCSSKQILSKNPGGATNYYEALKTWQDYRPEAEAILISDGQPNEDIEEMWALLESINQRVHTIFIGPKDDEESMEILKRIAELTGGTFSHIDVNIVKNLAKQLTTSVNKILALTE